jgi:predicted nucleic acid-binding protein
VARGLSFYDALIAQAAVVSGCEQLLSEDFQTGTSLSGVRVVNPFA